MFDYDRAKLRLDELNALAEDGSIWSDSKKAQGMMRERTRLASGLGAVDALTRDFNDAVGLIGLAESENDAAVLAEAEAALRAVRTRAAKAELDTLLSGEADGNDSYLEIHAGAG
ncbi:MAG: PCRF domain-containing protein, partial [Pseudomonadota bacterium]